MSLKEFLVVGQSFGGIRDEKSPFEMRKETLLPRFQAAPRFARPQKPGAQPLVQADWLAPEPVRPSEGTSAPAAGSPGLEAAGVPGPAPGAARALAKESVRPSSPKRNWLSRLLGAFGRFGLFGLSRRKPEPAHGLVQSELILEKVRVLRNDLADADLEVVPRDQKREARPAHSAGSSRNSGWSELNAKLFELGRD